MSDLVLDSEHDLVVVDGDIALHQDKATLTIQKVKMNLLLFKGEWFRDTSRGMPYLQAIYGRKGTQDIADTAIKNTIINTDNILSISGYTSSVNAERTLSVVFSAILKSGETISNVTLEI